MKSYRFSSALILASVTWLLPMQFTLAWAPTSIHPWAMFHGDYNHTGAAAVKGPQTATLKWRLKAAQSGEGQQPPNSVAIDSNGIIYLGAPTKIRAIKPDGTVKWHKNYTNIQGPALSPDGKTLYFAGDKKVWAVKAKNGDKKWKYSMDNSTLFGPTIGPDGVIYQGSWDSYLYAINPSGELKWKFQTAGAISYPATVNEGGTIFLGGGDAHEGPDSYFYAIKKNGELKWKYDTGATRVGSPVITADGTILAPAAPDLLAFDKDGNLLWDVGPGNGGGSEPPAGPSRVIQVAGDVAGIISPAVAPDGTIYIANSDGLVSAIDPDTQEVKWTYQGGTDPDDATNSGMPSFPVVDSKGTVYFGSVDGQMYALDKDGNLKWTYQTDDALAEAAPALGADGTLYFSSDDGYLYAIQD